MLTTKIADTMTQLSDYHKTERETFFRRKQRVPRVKQEKIFFGSPSTFFWHGEDKFNSAVKSKMEFIHDIYLVCLFSTCNEGQVEYD